VIKDRSVVAIIPVRGGSKGIPRKNLRLFNNISLLAHTIETAKKSRFIDRIIVTSEDAELIEEAKKAGAEVPFVRPVELAQDHTPGIDPVLHALDNIQHYDYTLLLQVTSPLRTTEDIDACIEHTFQADAPACVSVTEPAKHPAWMFTLNSEQQMTPLFEDIMPTRRQDLPEVFALNGAIYLAKTDWFKQNKSFITNKTISFKMPKERSIDIDSELDFAILEAHTKNKVY
jgi:CMP-N,N'-diacetyllegionaminic acid synthase